MDHNTGLIVLGGAIGSKDLVVKLLGPTADYLGEELQSFTQKRVENIKKIFETASRIAGDDLEKEGSVPPRVLKGIINEGSYINEELSSEYFGGVLASSRTNISRDDRGSTYISLLSRLSSYQIRTHYIFYTLIKILFNGENEALLESQKNYFDLKVYLPISCYCKAMEFDKDEFENRWSFLSQATHGLLRENLISNSNFTIGPANLLQKKYQEVDKDGIVFVPTTYGIDLFTWAHGHCDFPYNEFLNPKFKPNELKELKIPSGYFSVI